MLNSFFMYPALYLRGIACSDLGGLRSSVEHIGALWNRIKGCVLEL